MLPGVFLRSTHAWWAYGSAHTHLAVAALVDQRLHGLQVATE
jgi:hypothetical protein